MPPTYGPRNCSRGRIRLACETPTSYNNTGSGSGRLAAAFVPTGPNGWNRGMDVVHCDGAEPADGVDGGRFGTREALAAMHYRADPG
jgi:hypothetical protein